MSETLYRQQILDHYKHPHNFHELSPADISVHQPNPLCGDEITLFVRFDTEGKVAEASFTGTGCALSIAATSLFTDYIKGKTREELALISRGDIEQLIGTRVSSARIKCVELPLRALQKGLMQNT